MKILLTLVVAVAFASHAEAQDGGEAARADEPLSLVAEVSGPLVGAPLFAALYLQQPSIRTCLEQSTHPSVVYEITIGRNGRVVGLRLVDPGVALSEPVRACIEPVLRRASFPARHGVSVVTVRIHGDQAPPIGLPAQSVPSQGADQAASAAQVLLRLLEVRGPLSSVVVRRTLSTRLAELRACYAFHLRHRAPFEGDGQLSFTVSAAGAVSASAATELPEALARCLEGQASGWRFPVSSAPTQIAQGLRFNSDVPDWLLPEPTPDARGRRRDILPEGPAARPEIARVVQRRMRHVRACQRAAERRHPGFEGLVTVRFTILPSGSVGSRVVLESSFPRPTPRLDRCLLAEVGRWRFPGWRGGRTELDYPFDFHPR